MADTFESYLARPPVFYPNKSTLPLKKIQVVGIPLNWQQILQCASAICEEDVDDEDQAYDLVAHEIMSIGFELFAFDDVDPANNKPMLVFAVQDTIHEAHKPLTGERVKDACTWMVKNGIAGALETPMQNFVVGLPTRDGKPICGCEARASRLINSDSD